MREKCLHGQESGNHVDFKNGSYVDWESIGTLQRVLEFEKQKKKKKTFLKWMGVCLQVCNFEKLWKIMSSINISRQEKGIEEKKT